MNPRTALVRSIEAAVGPHNLVFVGIRGHDAAPLLAIEQFQDCFAVSAPLGAGTISSDWTLEQQLLTRHDLDTYDYDDDSSQELARFRIQLLSRLREPSLVTTYRPSHFIWNVGFASMDSSRVLGMFKDRQAAYEYKPWVETEVARLGLRTVPWRYVADESRVLEAEAFAGPIVLRASRTAGGAGVALARSPNDVLDLWPESADQLVAVGPYLEGALPLNVGACVYSPDSVVLHPGSVQLIGIPGATTRPFGYCGNDFAAFAQLDPILISQVDEATRLIGRWLGSDGYRGAFGVDYMWHEGALYFGEINPRMQGSTALSSAMAAALGVPDIVLDHLAATMGLEPSADMSLAQLARDMAPRSHLVVHNTSSIGRVLAETSQLLSPSLDDWDIQLLPEQHTVVSPGAILGRLICDGSLTMDGYTVNSSAQAATAALNSAFVPVRRRRSVIKRTDSRQAGE